MSRSVARRSPDFRVSVQVRGRIQPTVITGRDVGRPGLRSSLLPRGRNVGERLGLGRKRTTEEEVSASVLQHYSDQDG